MPGCSGLSTVYDATVLRVAYPPSVLPDISPSRGEIGKIKALPTFLKKAVIANTR